MIFTPPEALKPRKSPRQVRSRVTIDAVLEATIQVLLTDGPRRLSTSRVAKRAGVSVGTLYQYFPHKQALLYAVVQRYLDEVARAVEVCVETYLGQPLASGLNALATTYVDAKGARPEVALALYRVSSEMDVAGLVNDMFARMRATVVRLISNAPDARFDNVEEVAFTLLSALTGATRVVFENGASPAMLRAFRKQVCLMCQAYLDRVKHAPPGVGAPQAHLA